MVAHSGKTCCAGGLGYRRPVVSLAVARIARSHLGRHKGTSSVVGSARSNSEHVANPARQQGSRGNRHRTERPAHRHLGSAPISGGRSRRLCVLSRGTGPPGSRIRSWALRCDCPGFGGRQGRHTAGAADHDRGGRPAHLWERPGSATGGTQRARGDPLSESGLDTGPECAAALLSRVPRPDRGGHRGCRSAHLFVHRLARVIATVVLCAGEGQCGPGKRSGAARPSRGRDPRPESGAQPEGSRL